MSDCRRCKSCGENKPIEDFPEYTRRSGSKARRHKCRTCCRKAWAAYRREYTRRDPETEKKKRRVYLDKNRDRIRKRNRAWAQKNMRAYHLKKLYGLTLEQWNSELERVGHACEVCGIRWDGHNGSGSQLVVDHDHASGQYRGVLCRKCNGAAGLLGENYETARRLAEYIRRTKMQLTISGTAA